MSREEKDKFNEKWLSETINIRLMYKFFLETFLNQPDDDVVKKLKRVKFKEKRDSKYIYEDVEGNEYDKLVGYSPGWQRYAKEDGEK